MRITSWIGLTFAGLFCIVWAGVGIYSLFVVDAGYAQNTLNIICIIITLFLAAVFLVGAHRVKKGDLVL